MRIQSFGASDVDALAAAAELARDGCTRSLLVLAAEGSGWDADALDRWARRQALALIGGIFPRAICGAASLEAGGVVVGLPWPLRVQTVTLSARPRLPDGLIAADAASMLVLVDGLAPHIQPLIESLYDALGANASVAGGGGGSLSLRQMPCVLTNAGLAADVAALAPLPAPIGVGIRHGWQAVDADLLLQATTTDGNVIRTLDWEPAFDVYRRIVEPLAGVTIGEDNFFEVSKAYPLGLLRPDGEMIVRDPIRVQDGALVCVGAVRKNSTLTVLNGRTQTLLQAAAQIDAAARAQLVGAPAGRLVFDCISRALFLGEDFAQELARIAADAVPTVGALTLGEVAANAQQRLAFCNKTAAVALLAN